MSKEFPIVLSMSEVQAVLSGHKRMIRKIMEPQPKSKLTGDIIQFIKWQDGLATFINTKESKQYMRNPLCKVGDIYWVREGFHQVKGSNSYIYKADYIVKHPINSPKWKLPMQMKRKDSRIDLYIKEIRPEKIQDICYEDTLLEGIIAKETNDVLDYRILCVPYSYSPSAVEAYSKYWDARYGGFGFLWESNPWVWAMSFDIKVNNQKSFNGGETYWTTD